MTKWDIGIYSNSADDMSAALRGFRQRGLKVTRHYEFGASVRMSGIDAKDAVARVQRLLDLPDVFFGVYTDKTAHAVQSPVRA